jgi:hypothetical protein
MIRFTYRVLNPQKAKALSDKRLKPYLVDERAHVKLVVPSMEKVGQLRQSAPPEEGRSYWMLFSNKGGFVKRGDRVSVVIGKFHVDELVVQKATHTTQKRRKPQSKRVARHEIVLACAPHSCHNNVPPCSAEMRQIARFITYLLQRKPRSGLFLRSLFSW